MYDWIAANSTRKGDCKIYDGVDSHLLQQLPMYVPCEEEHQSLCKISSKEVFFLRGLCSQTYLDIVYRPAMALGNVLWIGASGQTIIVYDDKTRKWQLLGTKYWEDCIQ